ncbi:MAG: hypothetical protein ACQEXX_30355 [Bacillota bacterium]
MTKVESVFRQPKSNRGFREFRRFLLRGLKKVGLEVDWLSLAHSALKKHTMEHKTKQAAQG